MKNTQSEAFCCVCCCCRIHSQSSLFSSPFHLYVLIVHGVVRIVKKRESEYCGLLFGLSHSACVLIVSQCVNLCDCCDWFIFPFSYNWLFYYSPLYHTSLHYACSRNEIAGIVRKTICVSYIKSFSFEIEFLLCILYSLTSTMIENYYFVLFFIL